MLPILPKADGHGPRQARLRTPVSAMAAVGGAMGTFVGFKKLTDIREQERLTREREREHALATDDHVGLRIKRKEIDSVMLYAHDFARTMGYLGMYSIYGMITYPWRPLYTIGSTIRRDASRNDARNDDHDH